MPVINSQPRARRWKRQVLVVLLLLIGGAIVNVAVAWGIAAVPRATSIASSCSIYSDDNWTWVFQTVEFGGSHAFRSSWWAEQPWGSPPIPALDVVRGASEDANELIERLAPFERRMLRSNWAWGSYSCARYGWPLHSMWRGEFRGELTMGFQASIAQRTVFIPLRPLGVGFIINTLFYALLLWLLFFAPFAARRMLRRRRGLCAKCAYPVGVSPVCTECGAAVVRRQDS